MIYIVLLPTTGITLVNNFKKFFNPPMHFTVSKINKNDHLFEQPLKIRWAKWKPHMNVNEKAMDIGLNTWPV